MKEESDTPYRPPENGCPGPAETFAETPGEPKASTAGGDDATAIATTTSTAHPPPRKRRRNRKIDPDRKYECTFAGCTKSYSRAEHLQRHCLNRMLPSPFNCPLLVLRSSLCVAGPAGAAELLLSSFFSPIIYNTYIGLRTLYIILCYMI